jgi:hypothetical protein
MPDVTVKFVKTISTGVRRLKMLSPYNPDLPARARELGGSWDSTAQAWYFDPRDEERVRALALAIYGSDGSGAPVATMDLRVDLDALPRTDYPRYQPLWLGGRCVVERRDRDRHVILGDGVVTISGGFTPRGGSRANPSWDADTGTVLEVRDVPVPLGEAAIAACPAAITRVLPAAAGATTEEE